LLILPDISTIKKTNDKVQDQMKTENHSCNSEQNEFFNVEFKSSIELENIEAADDKRNSKLIMVQESNPLTPKI
jgi:hypothetical protein